MNSSNYMDVSVSSEQRRDRLQAAEEKMMLRRAGLLQRSMFARLMCAVLHGAGHLLTDLGQALIRSTGEPLTAPASRPPLTGTTAGR